VAGGVLVERQGRILVVTINRPDSRNAVNRVVSQGLADAIDELDTDAGGNVCAGRALKAFAEKRAPGWTGT
jgi:enoyl-CoA hydratase